MLKEEDQARCLRIRIKKQMAVTWKQSICGISNGEIINQNK